MTQPRESDIERRALARFRGALMAVLPKGHPVHDPTKAYTEAELEVFEQEFFDSLEQRPSVTTQEVFKVLSRLGAVLQQ